MALDEPSAQLFTELRDSAQSALASHRPILHHLNADTSWLVQIPRPERAIQHGSRHYYNVLIDPWFTGGQSDVASWFSQQFHATKSAVQSISELEELIRENEILASGVQSGARGMYDVDAEKEQATSESFVDVVAISHEFTDHCHKDTLLQVHPDVPVFAGKEAAKLISSWKHFRSVVTMSVFGANGDVDWRSTSVPPLPEWVGISRMLSKEDKLYYHSAVLITFNNRRPKVDVKLAEAQGRQVNGSRKLRHKVILPNEDDESAEALVYTPHGIQSGDLEVIPKATPPVSTLAFLHGLHNVRIGTVSGRTALQLNLGVYNGLKAQRILNANYWCGTHDEVKKGGGLVAFFLQREVLTLKDALDRERRARRDGKEGHINGEMGKVLDSFDGTNWIDLRNGESKILF